MGGEAIALDLEEQLGARPDDLERRRPHEEQVRAGVHPAQGAVQADPAHLAAIGRCRQLERLAPGKDHLDRLALGDRLLGNLDGVDVLVAAEAGRAGLVAGRNRLGLATSRHPARRRAQAGQLGRRRPRSPVEGLEDRPLGDPVAAVEVGDLGVQGGDRADRMGQVVEDDDQVGLDERGGRHADRIGRGLGHARLEGTHRVVGQGADGTAGEAGHALDRQDLAPGQERPQAAQRIDRLDGLDRQVRVEPIHAQRPALDGRPAAAHLEQPARADPQEAVAAESLAAFDRFEEVGRATIVEAQEGADRRLEIGVPRRPQEHRVGAAGQALGLGQAERIGDAHGCDLAPPADPGPTTRESKRPLVQGRKVEPSAVPPAFGNLPHSEPKAPGSIHRRCRPGFHQPPGLCAGSRRVLIPIIARYS